MSLTSLLPLSPQIHRDLQRHHTQSSTSGEAKERRHALALVITICTVVLILATI